MNRFRPRSRVHKKSKDFSDRFGLFPIDDIRSRLIGALIKSKNRAGTVQQAAHILEFFKEEPPNVREIFRRVVISILMLYSFDYVINAIALVGDGITDRIDGIQKLWDVLKNLGPNYNNSSGEWFNLRETAIYFFNIAAYIIAYLGFFVATALIHFVWTVLYICSPLMILMYVSKGTAYVTKSLYAGLVQVVTWKILYSILGVLLLKLAMNPQVTGMEDYLMSIIVNLCIGVSMLFIPFATKSLVNDGLRPPKISGTRSSADSAAAVKRLFLQIDVPAHVSKFAPLESRPRPQDPEQEPAHPSSTRDA